MDKDSVNDTCSAFIVSLYCSCRQ